MRAASNVLHLFRFHNYGSGATAAHRPSDGPLADGGRQGIRFTRITTADGLSQTRVAQIVQDDQGFMWFGTEYGLNRYDGYKFKLFVHDPQRPNSLGGNFYLRAVQRPIGHALDRNQSVPGQA